MIRACAQKYAKYSSTACFLLFFAAGNGTAEALPKMLNDFFAELEQTFEKIASASAVKKTKLSYTDRYFIKTLKKNQPFYSLLRINSKGIIISEVKRSVGVSRDFRAIVNQHWFIAVKQKRKEYNGFVRAKNGRYYLFWSKPLLSRSRSGKERFVGAIAAKIDLWDCIHEFTDQVNIPFLIRVNEKGLYSHKWRDPDLYNEEMLMVSGVEKISVRYPYSKPETIPETFEDTLISEVTEDEDLDSIIYTFRTDISREETISSEKPDLEKTSTPPWISKNIITAILIIIGLVLVYCLSRLWGWYRYKKLIKKIDREL